MVRPIFFFFGGDWWLLCLLFFAVVVLALWLRLLRGKARSLSGVRVVLPGVVVIESFLDDDEQARVCRVCLEHGYERWVDEATGRLNAWRQGRGRLYDSVARYPASVSRLCSELVDVASGAWPFFLKDERHTHLLLLYYADVRRGLGFHRDDGPIDGRSDAPVVSLSFGCACDFLLKHNDGDPPLTVRLNSGDAVLFGGPARHIMHAVRTIHPGTCPPKVADVHRRVLARAANQRGGGEGKNEDFRLNLTWRHAPELDGLETSDRFFHFGSATRGYLDTERTFGTDVARREAAQRRRDRRNRRKRLSPKEDNLGT